ncbi:MAG: hypothetical protein KJ592_04065 [Nanoarchaeota archaeon]|nr:hypothetical protein [Nanoarchaeota archaeon]
MGEDITLIYQRYVGAKNAEDPRKVFALGEKLYEAYFNRYTESRDPTQKKTIAEELIHLSDEAVMIKWHLTQRNKSLDENL